MEYLFYDSTSASSYSALLKQVKYEKNKDGDKLAQINLALLLGQSTGFPVYRLVICREIQVSASPKMLWLLPGDLQYHSSR